MQVERYVSTTKVSIYVLWSLAFGLIAVAWIVAAIDPSKYDGLGYGLALTAGVIAPAAAVCHVKKYLLSLTTLIRLTAGLQPEDERREVGAIHRIH